MVKKTTLSEEFELSAPHEQIFYLFLGIGKNLNDKKQKNRSSL